MKKGIIPGSISVAIVGDARSLDYSSYGRSSTGVRIFTRVWVCMRICGHVSIYIYIYTPTLNPNP